MPDGSVRIPVGLNFDTAIKDAQRLSADIKRILSNIDMSKADLKTLSFVKNLTNAYNRMQKLANEAQKLADTPIHTEEYANLSKELNTVAKRMQEVQAQQKKLLDKGQKYSLNYKNLTTELNDLDAEYHKISDSLTNLETSEREFVSGTSTQAYKDKENALNQVNQAANILLTRYSEMNVQTEAHTKAVKHETEALKKLSEAYQLQSEVAEGRSVKRGPTIHPRVPKVQRGPSLSGATVAFSKSGISAPTTISVSQHAKTREEILDVGKTAEEVKRQIEQVNEAVKEVNSNGLKRLQSVTSGTAKAMLGLGRVTRAILNPLSLLSKHSKDSGRHTDNFGRSMKRSLMTLLKYTLGIRSLYFLFRRLRSVAKEAIKVMVQEIPELNRSVSDIVTAFKGLKASVGTLVQPFIQMFAPAITLAIQKITELMNKMAQLFAMMAGQNYIYEASVDYVDYAKSVDEASGSLAGFDKLNVVGSEDKSGIGLTKDTVHYAKKYFDTINLADNQLFKTLKSILKLVKDIGVSFKKAWEDGAGDAILRNIKRWLDNILLTIQNITDRFDEAWNTAGLGDSIAETLLGIFSDISGYVSNITGDIAGWAETLDFTPLLESVQNLLTKIREFLHPVFTILRDIYNEIILPLTQWIIERLAPALGDLASSVLDKITKFLEWIEPKLKWLMENIIRPIAGAIGEGFLAIIKHVQELLDGPLSDTMKDLADFYESDIKPILEYVFGFLAVLLPKAINAFSNLAKTTLTTLSNLVGDVKDVLKGVIEFIAGVFTLDLDKALQGIKDIFKGIFNGILSIIEGLINGLIDVINFVGGIVGFELEHVHIRRWGEDNGKMPDKNASQEAKNAWNKKADEFEKFLNSDSIQNNTMLNALGVDTITEKVKIPRLASGAVLPPNQPFLAMVGDQKTGTNVETPLSTIEQAVANVIGKMGVKVIFDVKGDPNRMFKVWQREAKVYSMQFPDGNIY